LIPCVPRLFLFSTIALPVKLIDSLTSVSEPYTFYPFSLPGTNMSTVGVDIGDWVYEKRGRGSPHGPVTFRTWDFGGQREYYATHQYFLSKRSLYLVVWKIPDGQPAIDEILQW
jgi:hypothetical protein